MAKIWIIDDDAEFVENTAAILSGEGHTVLSGLTTEGAVESLVRDRPDVLVLDVMFPDNSVAGFELAREVRRNREIRNLPIILLTAVNQEFPMDFTTDDIDPHWMPVQDFVEKPVDPSILSGKIRNILKTNG